MFSEIVKFVLHKGKNISQGLKAKWYILPGCTVYSNSSWDIKINVKTLILMYYREVCVLNKHFWCCYFCYVVAYCLLFYTLTSPQPCVFLSSEFVALLAALWDNSYSRIHRHCVCSVSCHQICRRQHPHWSVRRNLMRSADTADYIKRHTWTKFGERCFGHAGPAACNLTALSLPLTLIDLKSFKNSSISPRVSTFVNVPG